MLFGFKKIVELIGIENYKNLNKSKNEKDNQKIIEIENEIQSHIS